MSKRDDRRPRAVCGLFYLDGVVAATAGLHTVLAGGRSFPRYRLASPEIESELGFYSAFYVAYGAALVRTAPRADGTATQYGR